MSAPRLLVRPFEHDQEPPAKASAFAGLDTTDALSILRVAGLAFVAAGAIDLALTWYPTHFGMLEWEFATISNTLIAVPFSGMGLMLAGAASVGSGHRRTARSISAVLLAIVVALGMLAALYALVVPVGLANVTDPIQRAALKRTTIKSCWLFLVYGVFFTWCAVLIWRHSAKRR